MLKPLYDLVAQLLSLSRDTQQNKADIKDVRQEIRDVRQEVKGLREQVVELRQQFADLRLEFRDLVMVVQRLSFDIRQGQEREAHERREMALRLENELLRFERRLPPAKPNAGQDAG